MKSADIKIGERYVVHHSQCGLVLETRVERSNWSGGSRKDGVRVKLESGHREGQEAVVASRDINETWEKYEERRKARELQRKISNQDRERVERAIGKLNRALEGAGVDVMGARVSVGHIGGGREHYGSLSLTEEAMATLTVLLGSDQVSERAEQVSNESPADPLAELLV